VYFGLALGVEFLEDPSVLAQDVIDIAHEIGFVAVLAIVKRGSALLAAEAFVRTADKLRAALLAFPSHWFLQF
jgi:hypothetical protein